MRSTLAAAIVVLALAPLAAAAVCAPACAVASTERAYLPAVLVVASGSTVTWTDADNLGHSATDRAGFCFNVRFPPGGSGSARFDVVDGALYATDASGTSECFAATRTPAGAFLLHYECLYHANMEADLLVK